MEDWGAVKTRLERYTHESQLPVKVTDIRAALERDTEWALKYDKLHDERHAEALKADALRQRVEELEREKVDGEFVCINADRAEAAEAEVERLRIGNAALAASVRVAEAVAEKAEAEVARLEGLILDWDGDGDSPSADSLYAEASRIRAQCRHGGRQQGETPCPDCSAQREEE